ncbi:MAG: TIGR03000 domain-containing protein [Gemmataceae bacterium]
MRCHRIGALLVSILCVATLRAEDKKPAQLRVFLPPDATLEIEGYTPKATGTERLFESPPLEPGKNYFYTLRAHWTSPKGRVTRMQLVRMRAGEESRAEFRPGFDRSSSNILFVPTPDDVVAAMLEAVKLQKDDVVFDLGCGDGRIVVTAAVKYGAHGVGVDIDPRRVAEARQRVEKENVGELVEIRHGDALKVPDLARASVVTLYMLPEFNEKLKPILERELKPGSRVVAHDFPLKGWKPVRVLEIGDATQVFLYEMPVTR